MSTMQPPPERLALEEASTADLVREMLDEAKELVKIEVELAKNEVEEEIAQAKKGAIALGIAAGCGVIVLCLLAVTLVLALGGTAMIALAVAAVFLVIAGIAAGIGWSIFPKKPLGRTRERLSRDVHQLKGNVA
jgi:uncharacterized membrane protein YqjE